MLTREDYEKIEDYLLRHSIKDSDFLENTSIAKGDYITIFNNTGNYKINAYTLIADKIIGEKTVAGGEIFNIDSNNLNSANAPYSHTEGKDNINNAELAHSQGFQNITEEQAVNSHVEGIYNIVRGWAAHAQNEHCEANGDDSFAGGYYSNASGGNSFAFGNHINSTNQNQASFGKYNVSESDSIFEIGIGTGETDRKNAFVIKEDGECYIDRIGGFNEFSSRDSLQEVIHNITRRIEELENLKSLFLTQSEEPK